MNDTPRTDVAEWRTNFANERVVHADFARQLERELAAAIKQRDEARRESCLWSLPKGVAWNDWMLARAKANAAERGWDCFEEGGGA